GIVRITPEELKVTLDGEEDMLVVDRSRATGTLSSTAPDPTSSGSRFCQFCRAPAASDDGTRPALFAPLVRVAPDQPERRLHHDPDRGAEDLLHSRPSPRSRARRIFTTRSKKAPMATEHLYADHPETAAGRRQAGRVW